MSEIQVGLRVDVDTLRGTRDGVPALVALLQKYDVKASFFMSVGPDNMGRHAWRLIKPKFLLKMLRSDGASLYGYDILLRGTAWPGPVIGERLPDMIRLPHQAGHEVGLHAWDHYTWQMQVGRFTPERMQAHLQRGFDMLASLLGQVPSCSAAASWRCNDQALLLKEAYPFTYNSDCRGYSIFCPVIDGKRLTPQIPVTLPTYDEIIGTPGVDAGSYNDSILDQCKADRLNVYTIHAEVEGIGMLGLFEDMLIKARQRGVRFMSLQSLLTQDAWVDGGIVLKDLPGREGWVAQQR